MPACPRPDFEIFCRVVDNYGDIGVCWRLARDLAARGLRPRLWVDDWATLLRLCPQAGSSGAWVSGVELCHWEDDFRALQPGVVVIEAFACELPAAQLEAMAAMPVAPAWLNLEYLSAENWVADCHLLASPHPRLALQKRFCFPGFEPRTGGLLREPGLLAARTAFQGDARAREEWLAAQGIALIPGALAVSLFAYGHPQLSSLLGCWADGERAVELLIPAGRMAVEAAAALGSVLQPGVPLQRKALRVQVLPFLSQDDYDRLLWSCDLNFVRGEDSFVRAQWAARPFVWQIYAQQADAHRVKLEAFLQRYTAMLDDDAAAALRAFALAWNGLPDQPAAMPQSPAVAWPGLAAALPRASAHAALWCEHLATLPDLCATLAQIHKAAVKS